MIKTTKQKRNCSNDRKLLEDVRENGIGTPNYKGTLYVFHDENLIMSNYDNGRKQFCATAKFKNKETAVKTVCRPVNFI